MRLTKAMCAKSNEDRVEVPPELYRSAVGSLMYAMIATRPDLATAVSAVSQFLEVPGRNHWFAVKRVLRYLAGTVDSQLVLDGSILADSHAVLVGYCDSDWDGDLDTRKSTTGYCFFLGRSLVSWCCKRQPTVAVSVTEAEYVAAAFASKEAIWLRSLQKPIARLWH